MAQVIRLSEQVSVHRQTPPKAPRRGAGQRVRLTEGRIEKAPISIGRSTYIYDLDVPGLAIRVTPKGVRTFVVVKKISGKARRITLGRWPGLNLSDARKAAKRIHGEIAAGEDPVARRKAARQQAETCSDFWPTYLRHIKRKNRTWKRRAPVADLYSPSNRTQSSWVSLDGGLSDNHRPSRRKAPGGRQSAGGTHGRLFCIRT